MGRIGCLLLVVVLLLIGYDQWRIEQLRREVSSLSGKVHIQNGKKEPGLGAKSDLVTALAETERHTKRAKELLRKHRASEAQAELDRALASLKSANTVSEDIVGDAAQFMGKARENAVKVFRKAWQDIAAEAKPKKVGVQGEGTK